MTKADLRTGMVVTIKNGTKFRVMLGAYVDEHRCVDVLVNVDGRTWIGLNDVRDDLTSAIDAFNIIRVETPCHIIDSVGDYSECEFNLRWERIEPKELTVAEIEKLLGYPIKVVKE